MTDTIINLLSQYNIPFNKKMQKDNIIIIPNGIIKVKNYLTIKNNTDVENFIKQITSLVNQYNFTIYIYLENVQESSYLQFSNIFYSHIDPSRVKLCYNIEMINIGEYFYGIRGTGAIWTLVAHYDHYYPIFVNKTILTASDTYKRAIVIMTDEEIIKLHTFNFCIIDDFENSDINICYITQNTFKERDTFIYTIKYAPLPGEKRAPFRVIEGVTINCPNCHNIVYYENTPTGEISLKKHTC